MHSLASKKNVISREAISIWRDDDDNDEIKLILS